MTITQTVEIPADYRLRLDVEVPRNIPTGKTNVVIQFPIRGNTQIDARTIEEALQMAEKRAADPNRKPFSRHFGKLKGIWKENGVEYQRAIRDEWD